MLPDLIRHGKYKVENLGFLVRNGSRHLRILVSEIVEPSCPVCTGDDAHILRGRVVVGPFQPQLLEDVSFKDLLEWLAGDLF